MPTVQTGLRRTFDNTNLYPIDLVNVLDQLDPRDVPLLTLLGMGDPKAGASSLHQECVMTQHRWRSDELIPNETTLAAAYTAAAGTITVASGTAKYFQVGDHIRIGEGATDNIARITAINTDTDVITITAGLGNSTDAAAASGKKVAKTGQSAIQGATALSNPRTTDIDEDYNYTKILGDVVRVPGTVEVVKKYFGITSEADHQELKKFTELAIQLEKAAIYDTRLAPASSYGGSMGSLVDFIRRINSTVNNANGLLVNNSAAALTEATFKTLLRKIWLRGGKPTHVMVNGVQALLMGTWISPQVFRSRDETLGGIIMNAYETPFGQVSVVINRHIEESDLIVIQRDMVGIGPLVNRAFFSFELGKTGDSIDRQIVGEYTMEVHGATRCHGMIYNLGT